MEEPKNVIRVKVSKDYLPFYKDLIKRRVFKQHSEFFTLCCSISGFKETEGDTKAFVELLQANTISDYQLTVLKSLIYKETNQILTGKELFSQAELLADKGFTYLIKHVLSDLIVIGTDGEISLMHGKEMDLQLKLSQFVSDELSTTPF
jgi:hypothetical protein